MKDYTIMDYYNVFNDICAPEDVLLIDSYSDFMIFTIEKAWIVRKEENLSYEVITPQTWNWNSKVMEYLTAKSDNRNLIPNAASKISKIFDLNDATKKAGGTIKLQTILNALENLSNNEQEN